MEPLPARILFKLRIQINFTVEEREPIVFCSKITGKDNLFAVVGNLCLTRVVILKDLEVFQTVEFLTELGIIWILGQEQPALQVVEAETFERKLNSALAANLVHKLILVGHVFSSNIATPQRLRITFTACSAVLENDEAL